MRNEKEIRKLMRAGMEVEGSRARALRAVSRARRQVGQRDTIGFALFRLWAVLAGLMAPMFASLGEHQARTVHKFENTRHTSNGPDHKGENA